MTMNSIIVILFEFKTLNIELRCERKIFLRMQAMSLLKKSKPSALIKKTMWIDVHCFLYPGFKIDLERTEQALK